MTRREFTKNVGLLINKMVEDGNEPVLNHAFRSSEEQQRLYDEGYSKLDGITKISKHQLGKAVDIYFFYQGTVDWGFEFTKELGKKYHDYWVSLGGSPMIEWDPAHYEGN